MRTKEEQVEYEDLELRLFGDKEVIEADPYDPEIKRYLYLRDLQSPTLEEILQDPRRILTVEKLMRDG